MAGSALRWGTGNLVIVNALQAQNLKNAIVHIVDLFRNEYDECIQFGRRGCNIYILCD